MNKEQFFWITIIVLLNIAAYLVGKHEGTRYGRENTIEILKLVAPNEMKLIEKKFDEIDPFKLALDSIKQVRAEKEHVEK
jgi:hypothetical protein